MRSKAYLHVVTITIALLSFAFESYAGGCSPSTTNGSCATAVTLTSGAACTNGNTCNGAGPASTCGSGECAWYQFTATSTDMIVNIPVTNVPGCYITSAVFRATGACTGVQISCSSGTPMDDAHYLNNLTVGNNYYIEVCEPQFGPCGGDNALFCIEVYDYTPCDECSTPCGVAQGFPTAPAVATVVAGCTAPDYSPLLQPGHTYTFCNTFTATATSVSFNVIITSNCGGGNVTNFSWSLYNYSACGAAIQTGTLASLTFTGLTIGNQYAFCYTFTVPSGCTHTKHCPYFVGATALPVKLVDFNAEPVDNRYVDLSWNTAMESNNDYFTIERSLDGITFEVVGIVDGAGNSNTVKNYGLRDDQPHAGISYYRLKQTDYDQTYSYSKLVSVEIKKDFDELNVIPNPVTGKGQLVFNANHEGLIDVNVFDVSGRLVLSVNRQTVKGSNAIVLDTEELTQGMYFLTVNNDKEKTTLKFIKN
ncbi:MAG: T9SS type A sorting domain-containing protein [Flavobacteriales bacterium]|nr:T9SS type A sorting domain-containing protein [Flavobacteriales bacterium]